MNDLLCTGQHRAQAPIRVRKLGKFRKKTLKFPSQEKKKKHTNYRKKDQK